MEQTENTNQTPEQNITAQAEEQKPEQPFFANGVNNNSFVKDNLKKVGIFIVLLNIFYPIGWHYKQWKAIKKNNEEYKNISPFWRGVFYPFYAFKLTKIIKELFEVKKNIDLQTITDAEELKKVKKEHKTTFAIWPYIIWISIFFLIFFEFTPDNKDLDKILGAIAWFLIYLPIHFLQHAINYILPKETKEKELSFSDLLGAPFLALVLAFFMFTAAAINANEEPECVSLDKGVFTNTCEKYSFTFPSKSGRFFTTDEGYVGQELGYGQHFLVFGQIDDLGNIPFTLEDLDKNISYISQVQAQATDKFSEDFNGNTAHCFFFKHAWDEQEKRARNIRHCFMQIKDSPDKIFIIIGDTTTERGQAIPEFMKNFMDSYKSLEKTK